jgi:eukaryotic-like serine/threonine-protein kinase
MQHTNSVKICPDCSYPNTMISRRCVECGKNLAGVKSEALFQVQPALPEEASLVTVPLSEPAPLPFPPTVPKDQSTLPLLVNEPALVQSPNNSFVKKISNMRTNLKRRNSLVVIIALFLILIIILLPLVIIPRIRAIANNNTTITATTPPTQRATPLHLPNALGEGITPAGQTVGVNDGSFTPFDSTSNKQEMAFKQQAAAALKNGDPQSAISLWQQALSLKSNDAEALIYVEDQVVLDSGSPYVTLVASTAFTPPFPDADYETYLQGIYVAQHEFNTEKHAFQLRILIANTGSDDRNTDAVAQQIVQIAQKDATVVGVIGWLDSADTLNAVSIFSHAKLPMISPQASSDILTEISPYFFRIVSPNRSQAEVAANFMKNTLHVKNPVVFVDHDETYSQNLAKDFENAFAPGVHLTEELFKSDNTKNFSSLIHDALKYHPDAFYFTSSYTADAQLFQDALPTTGPYATIPALAGDGGYVIHKNGYGRWYFTEYAYHGESNLPIAERFAQEYTADFDPGPHPQASSGTYSYSLANDSSILSYDATSVVLAALQMADSTGKTLPTPQMLEDTLPTITRANAFQGVSGQIAFGSDHDPVDKAIVILYASKDGHTQLYTIQGCFVKGCS